MWTLTQHALSSIQTISSKCSCRPKNDSRIEKKPTITLQLLASSQCELKFYFMTVRCSCDLTDMPRDGLLKTFHHSLAFSHLSSVTWTEDTLDTSLGAIVTLFTCVYCSDLFLLIGLLSGPLLTARAGISQDFPLVRRALISMSLCGCGHLAARATGVGLGRCGRTPASLDGSHMYRLLLAGGGCVGVRNINHTTELDRSRSLWAWENFPKQSLQ